MYVYTNAPVDYDYSYMVEIGELRLHGNPDTVFRILFTEDEYRAENYQIPRYESGLYTAWVDRLPKAF